MYRASLDIGSIFGKFPRNLHYRLPKIRASCKSPRGFEIPQRTNTMVRRRVALFWRSRWRRRRWRSCCFVVAQTYPHGDFHGGVGRRQIRSSIRPSVRSSNPEERVPVVLRSSHMWNWKPPTRPFASIISPITFVHPLEYIWPAPREEGVRWGAGERRVILQLAQWSGGPT